MKKFLVTVAVMFSLMFLLVASVSAENGCNISIQEVNGVHIINISGCKEISIVNDNVPVYSMISTPTLTPTVPAMTVTPVATQEYHVDNGKSEQITDKPAVHILGKDLNVRPLPNLDDSNKPIGIAIKDQYYEVDCVGADNWYKINFSVTKGFIHLKGEQGTYAELSVPNNMTVPACTS